MTAGEMLRHNVSFGALNLREYRLHSAMWGIKPRLNMKNNSAALRPKRCPFLFDHNTATRLAPSSFLHALAVKRVFLAPKKHG